MIPLKSLQAQTIVWFYDHVLQSTLVLQRLPALAGRVHIQPMFQCLGWLQNCQYAKQGLVLYVPQFIRRNMRKPSPGYPMMARGVQVPEQPLNISVQWGRKAQILAILLMEQEALPSPLQWKKKKTQTFFHSKRVPHLHSEMQRWARADLQSIIKQTQSSWP